MALRTVRVLSAEGRTPNQHETVNIVTTPDPRYETCLQSAAVNDPAIPQVIDSGGSVQGLRTICIVGYTAPA